jgi:hypothetical protein
LSGNTTNISGGTGGINIKAPLNSQTNIDVDGLSIEGGQITIKSNLAESDIIIAPMDSYMSVVEAYT